MTRPVAPSGLEAFEGLVRPICPHASNGFRENCEMHVRRKTHQFKVTWVFQAAHEGCDFIRGFFLRNPRSFLNAHPSVEIPEVPRNRNYILRDLGV
jgi:hypothetical protein